MARRPRGNQKTARVLTLSAAVGILGLSIWSGVSPSQRAWTAAHASTAKASAVQDVQAMPAVRDFAEPARPPATRCNSWDVSPVAMEAILREMVRRGWQPPRSDLALASSQPAAGRIVALSPEQPVWVSGRRQSAPVETGEDVGATIEPLSSDDSSSPAAPPVVMPAIPELPVYEMPAAPDPKPAQSITQEPRAPAEAAAPADAP
jgi:hypothetical protein